MSRQTRDRSLVVQFLSQCHQNTVPGQLTRSCLQDRKEEREPSLYSQKSSLLQNLLDILESVLDAVSFLISVHEEDRTSRRTPQQDNTADTTTGRLYSAPSPLRVVIESVPPAPSQTEAQEATDEREETRKRNTHERDRKRLETEKALACFTALLLVANVWLVLTTRDSNKLIHENFIRAQRPWVGIEGTPKVIKIQDKVDQVFILVSFSVKNYGVSPALHLVPGGALLHGEDFEELRKNLAAHCDADSQVTREGMNKELSIFERHGYTLLPGAPTPEQWDSPIPKRAYDSGEPAFMLGCATYKDQFVKTGIHHTPFCYHSKGAARDIVVPEDLIPCFWGQNAD